MPLLAIFLSSAVLMTLPFPDVLPPEYALKARFAFSSDVTYRDVGLVVAQGRIQELTSAARPAALADVPTFDLGNCALIPGLTNAHTHLEFSDLEKPLGEPGMPLPDWIRLVMQQRRGVADDANVVRSAFEAGLRESLSAGVTNLGEIATQNWQSAAFYESPISVTAFCELIATDPQTAGERLQAAVARPPWSGESLATKPGLSPHAPYSTSLELVQATVAASCENGWPVAMHLAESPEEIEFLRTGAGPFRELLDELNVWNANAFTPPVRPLDYLKILSGAPHAYVIHGNFLNDEELRFLADHCKHMTLVFCPRTHAFFRHESSPLTRAMELGVRIAIGTDSRASNPDLNLFGELQFLAEHTDVPRERILQWSVQERELQPGAVASLAIISIEDKSPAKPYELLFAPENEVQGTIISGALATKRV